MGVVWELGGCPFLGGFRVEHVLGLGLLQLGGCEGT